MVPAETVRRSGSRWVKPRVEEGVMRWAPIGVKRCLYLLAAVTIALLMWAVLPPHASVSRGNYNKIRVGMTEAEVEALLGGPGEDLAPLTYEDVHVDELPPLQLHSLPYRLHHWRSNTHMITVIFDREGRVAGKTYSRDPTVSFLRRFIDWLGL
jgi:hypothetical protein